MTRPPPSSTLFPYTTLFRSEDTAVELHLRAVDLEFGLLADVARRLAHDAVQSLAQVAERQRAHAHQVLLQLAADTRLLKQRRIGLAEILHQPLLDREGVVQALGHHARQLLQSRVAIELERIEFLLALG